MTPPDATTQLLRDRRDDRFHDECGVFGVHGHAEAANINEKILDRLPGRHAIGHVRYSTAGASQLRNAQPFCATTDGGAVAIAHNGNLVNANAIRRELEGRGAIFSTTADSEVIVQLLARSRERSLEERLIDALSRVKGAFSLVMLTADGLIAARDPHGFRPLSLGRLDGAWVAASETCALDLIGASHERDLEPGEVVVIRRGRLRSLRPFTAVKSERFCIFEYIYFARPDSNLNRQNVYTYRKELGRVLAREHPVAADLVVPVLDSGNTAALGYAEESGIPYEQAMIRNHYVRRTFIEPAQSIRHFGVKVKHNAVQGVLQGKRVVLVDDSIVRGTTLIKLVTMLRNAGAREVHVRISAPPTVGPCYYGIDTPTREELIANVHTVDEIRDIIGADSLGYLSLEGLRRASEALKHGFCDACFSDEYPVPVEEEEAPPQLSLFREVEGGDD
jgi:amidophosphoribosyltransferase